MKPKLVSGVEVHRDFGNVFADLGLVIEIRKAMKAFGLNQQEAAKRMGISQPKVSDMMRGNFTNLSVLKLMGCLTRLGDDIEIKVRLAKSPIGHLMLAIA